MIFWGYRMLEKKVHELAEQQNTKTQKVEKQVESLRNVCAKADDVENRLLDYAAPKVEIARVLKMCQDDSSLFGA